MITLYDSHRIEWLLSRGFADWFRAELGSGRAIIPGSTAKES